MDEACKQLETLRHLMQDIGSDAAHHPSPLSAPHLFADNQGGVDWSHSASITKRLRYLNIREVAIQDAVAAKEISLHHIPGEINPADIFTKEMKDKKHFIKLRAAIMSPR